MVKLAGCVILNDEDKLLLLHRNTLKRVQWETPGGKIEEGEEPRDAASREVAEETGLQVEIIRELGRKEFVQGDTPMLYIWFLATFQEGAPQITEPDIYDDIQFFSWAELEKMTDLSANTQNLVAAYQANDIGL